jgi:hypothetical protein
MASPIWIEDRHFRVLEGQFAKKLRTLSRRGVSFWTRAVGYTMYENEGHERRRELQRNVLHAAVAAADPRAG